MKTLQLFDSETCPGSHLHQVIDDALPGVVAYATYAEALAIHAERLVQFPAITNRSEQPKSVV